MKQGLHFGGRFHKVERFIPVGQDTLCFTCCHSGHTTYGCPTPDRVRCAICAEAHLTEHHKCPISMCKTGTGKFCSKHGTYKCANCGGSYTARSPSCPDQRQAIAIARSGREEWREREKEEYNISEYSENSEMDIEEVTQEQTQEDLETERNVDPFESSQDDQEQTSSLNSCD